MAANRPTLPVPNALQTTLATLLALGLALLPGGMASENPIELIWLALDGCGLMLV